MVSLTLKFPATGHWAALADNITKLAQAETCDILT